MIIKRLMRFPFYTYIEVEEKPNEVIRVNAEDNTFTYQGRDYKRNQSIIEFINSISQMDEEVFDLIIKGLNNASLR